MELDKLLFWIINGTFVGAFLIIGYLLKNLFESVKKELAELKHVMESILKFIAKQTEKNEHEKQQFEDIWNKIDEIETKQEDIKDTIGRIRMLHFKNHNEQI